MMSSVLALFGVSGQRDIEMEMPRKSHLEVHCTEWERALKESVNGEERSPRTTYQKFQERQRRGASKGS